MARLLVNDVKDLRLVSSNWDELLLVGMDLIIAMRYDFLLLDRLSLPGCTVSINVERRILSESS